MIVNETLPSVGNRFLPLIFVAYLFHALDHQAAYLMNNGKDKHSFSREEKMQNPSWSDSLPGFVNPAVFESNEIIPVS